ncbi:MAG: CBS domain-containing protein [Bacteroidia bacterium]|nr:CBS domain-containing protein [Bacteroidia bacterium]MDW8235515.1 CBS domain-containing protein [Bacteroidia bacterium]
MNRPSLSLNHLLRYRKVFLPETATAAQARQLFHRFPRLYHLPIVSQEGKYVGLFSKRQLARKSPETSLLDIKWHSIPPLPTYATVYDALQHMENYKTPEVAVADEEGLYQGLITTDALVRWWSHLGAVQEPGAVLILEAYLRDYSLVEIASILESDEIRILSAYLLRHEEDLQKTYIVLKVNSIYLARSIELLERKGYRIAALHGDLLMEKNARDQLQALLRYLSL